MDDAWCGRGPQFALILNLDVSCVFEGENRVERFGGLFLAFSPEVNSPRKRISLLGGGDTAMAGNITSLPRLAEPLSE
jgi:hypothetical protein